MADAKPPMDPRLALIVVSGVTLCFLIVAISSALRDKSIPQEMYFLFGGVAGAVLGYGAMKGGDR